MKHPLTVACSSRKTAWKAVSLRSALTALLLVPLDALNAIDLPSGLGADANPTGQPIGGGLGYNAGPNSAQAAFRVATLKALQRALTMAKAGDLVWIEPDNEIDLAEAQLTVPEKVTLAGDRGINGAPGPLLTVAMSKLDFRIQLKPGARLTGVRLRGPNPLMRDIDSERPSPSNYAIACMDAEVDNCEISQFQRGGIALFRDSVRGHVHHNYLHDIAAYPVLVGKGSGDCHVIEANRIEWAWHALASNGSRGSGYTARYNVFVRVPRPKSFDGDGADSPNWCLDVHANTGEPTTPPRPGTRTLVVHHNTFLAAPDVRVGDGSELLKSINIYPKHDIFVGPGDGLTTTVNIHHNRFLMHEQSGSQNKFKPYGRAIRLMGFKGEPAKLTDDPAPEKDIWRVTISDNVYGGHP